MNTLALRFGLPAELETLIDTGVLRVTGEDDAAKTLHLVVPSLRRHGRPFAYRLPLRSSEPRQKRQAEGKKSIEQS